MKTFFIEAKYGGRISFAKEYASRLPNKICLAATVQFIGSLEYIKKMLESEGKKVTLAKATHSSYPGQILGCSRILNKEGFDAFLYIGDGMFHPKELLLQSEKEVFVFNPLSKRFFKLGQKEFENAKKRLKGGMIRFLSSTEIGVVISTKPGQLNLKRAFALKEKYKDKRFYFLLFDTVDFHQLENFSFIECFVNTACPRIALDDHIRINKPVVDVWGLTA